MDSVLQLVFGQSGLYNKNNVYLSSFCPQQDGAAQTKVGIAMRSITKNMNLQLDAFNQAFVYTTSDFDRILALLDESEHSSSYYEYLRDLCGMLRTYNVCAEPNRSPDYYKGLVKDLLGRHIVPSIDDLNRNVFTTLLDSFDKYPSPSDFIQRVVDLQEDPARGWCSLPLRLRILKTFVQDAHALHTAGFQGGSFLKKWAKKTKGLPRDADWAALADALTEDVFDVLETAGSDLKKTGGDYDILRLADDLAQGWFRVSGSAKQSLYLFAVAYRLTFYYEGRNDAIKVYETDFQELIADWYSNNLLRFVNASYPGNAEYLFEGVCPDGKAGRPPHAGAFETEPSGYGINYGNYMELIYLYALSKTGMTPVQKLELISKLSDRVRETVGAVRSKLNDQAKETGSAGRRKDIPATRARVLQYLDGTDAAPDLPASAVYIENAREATEHGSIFSLDENGFVLYLLHNCACDATNRNPFSLQDTRRRAFQCYKAARDTLRREVGSLSECNYGLWFADTSAFARGAYRDYWAGLRDDQKTAFANLCVILKRMNDCIGYTIQEVEDPDNSNRRAESRRAGSQAGEEKADRNAIPKVLKKTQRNVTRSSLLGVYYYLYTKRNEQQIKSFEKVYKEFDALTRPALEASGYTPLSKKSLFDILLVFSAYTYIQD